MSIEYVEDLHLYLIEFEDRQVRTRVTHNPVVVEGWVTDNLPGEHPIAVAAKPFRNGRGLALLQILSNNSCLVYQLCHGNGEIPASLRNMLENPNYTVVGVSMNKLRQRLSRRFNLLIANPVELRDWVQPEDRNGTIRSLARRVLQIPYQVPRKIRRSRWSKKGLGRRQVLYATLDAFVTHLLAEMVYMHD